MVPRGRLREIARYSVISGVILMTVVVAGLLRKYDQVTKIDREVPTAVVREYVDALFARKDKNRAALFACSDRSLLKPLVDLSEQLKRQDEVRGTSTQVVISSIRASEGGSQVDT